MNTLCVYPQCSSKGWSILRFLCLQLYLRSHIYFKVKKNPWYIYHISWLCKNIFHNAIMMATANSFPCAWFSFRPSLTFSFSFPCWISALAFFGWGPGACLSTDYGSDPLQHAGWWGSQGSRLLPHRSLIGPLRNPVNTNLPVTPADQSEEEREAPLDHPSPSISFKFR